MLSLIKDIVRPLYRYSTNGNQRAFVALLSKFGKAPRNVSQEVEFLDFKITAPDPLSFVYQFKEIFLDQSYKFSPRNANPLIIDCGANIGTSCLFFRKSFPEARIIAIEADPEIFETLKGNLRRNNLDSGIEFINKAVWINNDGVSFTPDGADGGSIKPGVNNGIAIPSIRLRDLLKNHHVDFLKIDIEGAENDVLPDCADSLSNVDHMFIEYHSRSRDVQRLDELLGIITGNGMRYFIQSPHLVDAPFLSSLQDKEFDLQLNIFCYRNETRN